MTFSSTNKILSTPLPSIIFRREPTFAFWQPMSPPRKSSSSSGSGGLSKFGLVCAKYFHASPQVSPSGPDQPLFLPILCGSASIQESIIFFPVITIMMYDMCGHRDEDWRIYCLKITRPRDEVGSSMFQWRSTFGLSSVHQRGNGPQQWVLLGWLHQGDVIR